MINNAVDIIIVVAPAIVAVLSCVGAALKVGSAFKQLRQEVKDRTDLEDVKAQFEKIQKEDKELISEMVQQNYQLQSQVSELTSELKKVKGASTNVVRNHTKK